jgi:hypothetical protein
MKAGVKEGAAATSKQPENNGGPKPEAGHLPNGAPAQTVPAPDPKPESTVPQQGDAAGQDDAEIAARKERIRELWAENQAIQPRNKKNRFELGKELDELHKSRAHHGNGSYDKDVAALGIPKPTAWRIRNYYRELAGLAPVPQFVSPETNSTIAKVAAGASNVAMEVRSALINEGFKQADVDKVELDAAWDFAEAYRNAHRQLRPGPNGATTAGMGSSTGTTQPTGAGRSVGDTLRDRAKKTKTITQVRLEPSRHELFHQALTRIAAVLGTKSDSKTIFQVVTTYEVPPCAK